MVRTGYFQISADRKSARQRRSKVSGDHRTCVMKLLENYFDVPHAALVLARIVMGALRSRLSRRAENIVSGRGGLWPGTLVPKRISEKQRERIRMRKAFCAMVG